MQDLISRLAIVLQELINDGEIAMLEVGRMREDTIDLMRQRTQWGRHGQLSGRVLRETQILNQDSIIITIPLPHSFH